jgi:hypothetical protein
MRSSAFLEHILGSGMGPELDDASSNLRYLHPLPVMMNG